MKLAIIILNYRSWKASIEEVARAKKLFISGSVEFFVIDNNSGDGSYERLQKAFSQDEFVTVIKSPQNKGYAAGNNIGLKAAADRGFDYSLILNSDIVFPDDKIVNKMLSVFQQRKNIAAVSPVFKGPDGYVYNPEVIRQTFYDMTFGMASYRKKGRSIPAGLAYIYVYRPQGACMLVDNKKIREVGFLDEHTFLYYEESILAERLINAGYRCALCCDTHAVHMHTGEDCVSRAQGKNKLSAFMARLKYLKIYEDSFNYYLKQYRGFSLPKRALCSLFLLLKLLVLKR